DRTVGRRVATNPARDRRVRRTRCASIAAGCAAPDPAAAPIRRSRNAPAASVDSIIRHCVIRVAIQPPLPRLRPTNDPMVTGLCMLGGVTVRRAVATQRRATGLTRAQVYPLCPNLHTFLTLAALGVLHVGHLFQL